MTSVLLVDTIKNSLDSADTVAFGGPVKYPGSILQIKQEEISEITISANATLSTLTFTPKQVGSKIYYQLYIPNVTGSAGGRATFEIYGGTDSTATNNTKIGKNRLALDGTGADETVTLYMCEFGMMSTVSTNTHYLFARLAHTTNTVLARHSDGTSATKGKLIMMEIAQ